MKYECNLIYRFSSIAGSSKAIFKLQTLRHLPEIFWEIDTVVRWIDGKLTVYMIGVKFVLYRQQLNAARIFTLAKSAMWVSLLIPYKLRRFEKKIIQTTRQSSLLKNYTPASDCDIIRFFDQTLRVNPHWDITIWCPITDGAFMHQILARQLTLHHNATSASFHFIGHRMRLEHFRHKPFDQPLRKRLRSSLLLSIVMYYRQILLNLVTKKGMHGSFLMHSSTLRFNERSAGEIKLRLKERSLYTR